MASPASPPGDRNVVRVRLLDELRRRLERADELTVSVRSSMASADASGIEAATAEAETLCQEFKVLAEEYARLADDPDAEPDAESARALADFERTAVRLARSSALTGGLLERMLAVARGLLGLLGLGQKGTYQSSGRPSEFAARGTRFGEWV